MLVDHIKLIYSVGTINYDAYKDREKMKLEDDLICAHKHG